MDSLLVHQHPAESIGPQAREQLADAHIGDGVADRRAIAARRDEPAPAQAREVVGDLGLCSRIRTRGRDRRPEVRYQAPLMYSISDS
jgi:hypothetical protein